MSYWILEKKGDSAALPPASSARKSIQTTLHGFAKPGSGSSEFDKKQSSANASLKSMNQRDGESSKRVQVKRKRNVQHLREEEDGESDTCSVVETSRVDASLYDSNTAATVLQVSQTTPKRTVKRRRKRWGDATCAPAISPKKRKSLIEQSAKDVAAQQDRQRARKALLPIDNTLTESDQSPSPESSKQRRERSISEATPSPLRNGFSIVQISAYNDIESDEENIPSSPLLNKSSSPVVGATGFGRTAEELPRRRILARETQLLEHTLNEVESSGDVEIADDVSAKQSISLQSSQIASEQYARRPNMTTASRVFAFETATIPACENDEDVGDVTVVPSVAGCDGGIAAVCNDDQTQPLCWEKDGEAVEEAGWTNALSDEIVEEVIDREQQIDEQPAVEPQRGQRRTQSWLDIDRLWSGHLGGGAGQKNRHINGDKQSDLQLHGFSKRTTQRRRDRSPSPMSGGEDVPSDIDECKDAEDITHVRSQLSMGKITLHQEEDQADQGYRSRPSELGRTTSFVTSSSETQSLPWDDEYPRKASQQHDEHAEEQEDSFNIPSDSGLDTQMREFFAQL